MKSSNIQSALQLKHRDYFRVNYMNPSIDQGFVERTNKEKPNSPLQKYSLTPKGIVLKEDLLKQIGTNIQLETRITDQTTGQASGQVPDHDTDFKTNNDTDCVTDHDTVYDTA